MNSPEREEVSRQLAEELKYRIVYEDKFLMLPNGQEAAACATEAEILFWDALIDQRMRIRELEEELFNFGLTERLGRIQSRINSKGEKG